MPTFTVSIPGGRIGNFLAGAAVASVIGGAAVAVTSPDFTYSATKTGYYTIHPSGLVPYADGLDYFVEHGPPRLFQHGASNGCYETNVNLPHGSRITQLAVWFRSPPASPNRPSVLLLRTTLSDGSWTLLSNYNIPDDSNTRKLAVIPIAGGSSLVSNIGFAYGFAFCPGPGGDFFGARIAYTYTSAGD